MEMGEVKLDFIAKFNWELSASICSLYSCILCIFYSLHFLIFHRDKSDFSWFRYSQECRDTGEGCSQVIAHKNRLEKFIPCSYCFRCYILLECLRRKMSFAWIVNFFSLYKIHLSFIIFIPPQWIWVYEKRISRKINIARLVNYVQLHTGRQYLRCKNKKVAPWKLQVLSPLSLEIICQQISISATQKGYGIVSET